MTVGVSGVGDDLYREIILDHFRNPRHRGAVEPADLHVEGSNPLCGDELDLSLRVRDGAVDAIGFTGQGCSISQASASMMCEELTGRSVGEAATMVARFRSMLLEDGPSDDLGDLEALQGVKQYPARIKCAVLAWSTLQQALDASAEEAPA